MRKEAGAIRSAELSRARMMAEIKGKVTESNKRISEQMRHDILLNFGILVRNKKR